MKIRILLPFGIILALFFIFLALPTYLPEYFYIIFMFVILFSLIGFAARGLFDKD